jgi:hypothetical protein
VPRTGGVIAAAAVDAVTTLVGPMSASEAPATVMPAAMLILAISMTVMLPSGAETPLKRR